MKKSLNLSSFKGYTRILFNLHNTCNAYFTSKMSFVQVWNAFMAKYFLSREKISPELKTLLSFQKSDRLTTSAWKVARDRSEVRLVLRFFSWIRPTLLSCDSQKFFTMIFCYNFLLFSTSLVRLRKYAFHLEMQFCEIRILHICWSDSRLFLVFWWWNSQNMFLSETYIS